MVRPMMITLFLIAFVAGILVGACLYAMMQVALVDAEDDPAPTLIRWPAPVPAVAETRAKPRQATVPALDDRPPAINGLRHT